MKNFKVLGTGCANCKTTMKLIEDAAAAKGEAIVLERPTNHHAVWRDEHTRRRTQW